MHISWGQSENVGEKKFWRGWESLSENSTRSDALWHNMEGEKHYMWNHCCVQQLFLSALSFPSPPPKRKFHLSLSYLSEGKSPQNKTQAIDNIQFSTPFPKKKPQTQASTTQTTCSLFSAYLWSSSGSNTVSTVHAVRILKTSILIL